MVFLTALLALPHGPVSRSGLLGRPVLAGVSRKSMFTRELGITAEEALPATTAANAIALERGAAILRVHDVEAAVQAVEVVSRINQQPYV